MLKIQDSQLRRLEAARHDALVPRVDAWLRQHHPEWPVDDPAQRHAILSEVMGVARQAGMEVETDFALFSYTVVMAGPDYRDFLSRPDVAQIVHGTDRNPPSKILALDHLAFGDEDEG